MTQKKLSAESSMKKAFAGFPDSVEVNTNLEQSSLEHYAKLPNPGLRSFMSRTVSGEDLVVRTPLFKGQEVSTVMQNWLKQLDPLETEWPTLYQFEIDLAEKVGPMSVMKPLIDRADDVRAYYDGILLPSVPVPDSAINALIEEWVSARGLRVRSPRNTLTKMKLSKSSGTPYFIKKNKAITQTMPSLMFDTNVFNQEYAVYQCGLKNHTAILGWRGQEGGPTTNDVKQRVIWMFPFSVSVMELSVYQVLVEACQHFDLVSPWVGNEAVDRKITKLFDTKDPDDLVVCTDFTKFDQHFNESCSKAAHDTLRALFTADRDFEFWMENVFPIKYEIPLLCSEDVMIFGKHGMASGSGGTNADETLFHRAIQHEAALNDGQKLNPNSMCLGDDGILTYPKISVDSVVKTYSSHGQVMNTTKQYASTEDCVFLRRWHHQNYRMNGECVGVYSTCRALGKLMYMERFKSPKVWGPEAATLRTLSILENVKYHPLREKFADYVLQGDKFRLGLDLPGFYDNLGSSTMSSEFIDQVRDSMSYSDQQGKSDQEIAVGINSWWIVNYIKSKA